jgi:hypothetical protein
MMCESGEVSICDWLDVDKRTGSLTHVARLARFSTGILPNG